MKKVINIYRVFYSTAISLVTLLLVPAVLILFTLFSMHTLGEAVIYVIASMLGFYEMVFDYIVFAGICSRQVPPRILKSAYYGGDVLKSGLIQDCIGKFFYNIVILLLVALIPVLNGYGSTRILLMAFVTAVSVYTVTLMASNGLRYLVNMQAFMGCAMVVTMANSLLSVYLYFQLVTPKATNCLWILGLCVAAIAVSIVSVWHVMKRYQISFYSSKKEKEDDE